MNTEQERAEFEAWLRERKPDMSLKRYVGGRYMVTNVYYAWEAYQAGRAALQSQDRDDAERYRTLVASGKFVPATLSPSCLWGLRTSGTKATKAELDEAIDHARRIEGN